MKQNIETYPASDFHNVLHEIATTYGREVLSDVRAEGLLSDMIDGGNPFTSIMRNMRNSGIVNRLMSIEEYEPEMRFHNTENLKMLLQDSFFIRPGVACYIIDSYCFALGIVSDVPDFNICKGGDKAESQGEFQFVDCEDGEFCGYKDSENHRSGFGILRETKGSTYAGEWRSGLKMGFGIGLSRERERYAGEWRINRHSGVGVELQNDGVKYAGLWKNGKRHGSGMLVLPNGNVIFGQFSNGKFEEGYGMMTLQNGDRILGHMTSVGPKGECLRILGNGSQYKEVW